MMDAKEFFIKAQRICEESICNYKCPLKRWCDMISFDNQKIEDAIEFVENYKLEEEE